jgi:hypothetical protein
MSMPVRESDYFKAWILIIVVGMLLGGVIGSIIGAFVRSYYIYYPSQSYSPRVVGLVVIACLTMATSYFVFRFFVSRIIVGRLQSTASANSSNNAA